MRHHLRAGFWWIFGVRGLLGLGLGFACLAFLLGQEGPRPESFGLALVLRPFETVAAILLVLGAYAFLDGLFALLLGFQNYGKGEHWWSLALEGFLSLGLGFWTWVFPATVAPLVLLDWIATWAFLTGVLEILQALKPGGYPERRVPFLTAGLVSVVFGLSVLFLHPAGVGLVGSMAAYAFAFALPLLLLAVRLHRYSPPSAG